MSRNSSSVSTVLPAIQDPVEAGSGLYELVAPQSGIVLMPKSAVISSHAGGPFEYQLLDGSGVFLHGHVSSNSQEEITWPEGFELANGSGIYIESLANDGTITLYYSFCDMTPGITKEAARAATYQASLLSPKAIRTPNRFGEQVEG